MSEDNTGQELNSEGNGVDSVKSPSELFEAMIADIHNRQKNPKSYVSGAYELSETEFNRLDNFLNSSHMQDYIGEVAKNRDRTTFGIVYSVVTFEGLGRVEYVDDSGMKMGFVYDPEAEQFKEAREGFKAGDIIMNEFKNGNEVKSVKPVELDSEKKLEVINKISDKYDQYKHLYE